MTVLRELKVWKARQDYDAAIREHDAAVERQDTRRMCAARKAVRQAHIALLSAEVRG